MHGLSEFAVETLEFEFWNRKKLRFDRFVFIKLRHAGVLQACRKEAVDPIRLTRWVRKRREYQLPVPSGITRLFQQLSLGRKQWVFVLIDCATWKLKTHNFAAGSILSNR